MKIAVDASLLGARFSGVERSVGQLLRALPRVLADDDRLLVYVGDAFDDYVAQFHPDGFDPSGRLELVRTGVDNRHRGARIWWQQVVLPRLVHQAEADVFHGPAYINPMLMRTPSVLTLYDLLTLEEPQFATVSNQLYYQLCLRAGARRAARIIVPSAHARASVAKLLPELLDRTVTIPLGVDERFVPAAELGAEADRAVWERYRLPARYVLWVGNVEPKKNLRVLLSALKLHQRQGQTAPRLVLAGPLSWGTNDLMRQLLADGLQDRVTFLGRVTDAELPSLYRGARGLVFPSLAEGFGLPVLEAMGCGVPVLAADAGSLPEVVGDAGALLPANDAAAWAAAWLRLADDQVWHDELAARGRQWVQHFSWRRTAEATLHVYRAAAAA